MNFEKSIIILNKFPNHKREVRVYLSDTRFSDISALSELDLEDIVYAIFELEKLIKNKDISEYYAFGVDFCSVQSNFQISKCKDDIQDLELEDISTTILLHFLKELEKFKRKFAELNVLKDFIKEAFEIIKNNPLEFKKWENGNYYKAQIEDITILLTLTEDDFKFPVSEYLNEINDKLF